MFEDQAVKSIEKLKKNSSFEFGWLAKQEDNAQPKVAYFYIFFRIGVKCQAYVKRKNVNSSYHEIQLNFITCWLTLFYDRD